MSQDNRKLINKKNDMEPEKFLRALTKVTI